ncbi:putative DNA-binding protein (MmcQ/YjbR family) [Brevibacterium sanguinis]|uniref:DNA-binding protein (MmcQ/YjbR family) n=2 Tax=Brevibacterium TaxID=1696 RepID=A0ABX9GMH5_9MICO|nr:MULTISPECIES: MmcQ/YjbR family DNA-binding protein [Brevibacterium]RBP62521.1 putative DNA-binding protein (MmcQ/YjbR family) [Brevibacterium sanguinis]RBP69185.1 putative DNA-binding protein (MmcQ/YjbR family) [Brevibacterium celere]
MAHERMFDPDDPLLHWFRSLALALPGAQEKISHGRPAFYTVKIFAVFGAAEKLRPAGMEQHPHAMIIKPDPIDVDVLLEREEAFRPAYFGPSGWVGLELEALTEAEVRELLVDSHRQTAPTRLRRLLDD